MNNRPRPNSIWKHHKGHQYEVISIVSGKSSETPDNIEGIQFVHYTALNGPHQGNFYVRPLAEFIDGRFTEIDQSGSQYY